MSTDETVIALRKLKKTHENFAVGIGVTIGIILFGYFFSFAAFIDHLKSGLVVFQLISTIAFVFCLIFLKRVALFCTKLKYSKQAPYNRLLEGLKHQDFEKDEQTLGQIVAQRINKE